MFCGSLPDKFHTYFNDICNASTKIYKKIFQNSGTWLQTNINLNTSLRNRHLISLRVGDWYDYILKTKLLGLQRILDLSNVSSLDICFFKSQISLKISLLREKNIQIYLIIQQFSISIQKKMGNKYKL